MSTNIRPNISVKNMQLIENSKIIINNIFKFYKPDDYIKKSPYKGNEYFYMDCELCCNIYILNRYYDYYGEIFSYKTFNDFVELEGPFLGTNLFELGLAYCANKEGNEYKKLLECESSRRTYRNLFARNSLNSILQNSIRNDISGLLKINNLFYRIPKLIFCNGKVGYNNFSCTISSTEIEEIKENYFNLNHDKRDTYLKAYDELKKEIGTFKNTIEKINDLKKEISLLESEVNSLTDCCEKLRKKIFGKEKAKIKIAEIEKEIAGKNANIDELNSELEKLCKELPAESINNQDRAIEKMTEEFEGKMLKEMDYYIPWIWMEN